MSIYVFHVIEAFGKNADGVSGIVRLMAEQLAEDLEITIAASSIEGIYSQTKYNVVPIYLHSGFLSQFF